MKLREITSLMRPSEMVKIIMMKESDVTSKTMMASTASRKYGESYVLTIGHVEGEGLGIGIVSH